MNDDYKIVIFATALGFFGLGLILGSSITTSCHQSDAIKAGIGYYDPQTGTFKYGIPE